MDSFQPIYPPGFRPTDGFGPGGFGPGSGSGNPDAPQTVNPPQQTIASVAQESQSPQTMSSMTMSMDSAPTNNSNQPPVGGSSSTDIFNVPVSASVLSVGGASITASAGSSSTIVGFQSTSPVSTLFNSASTPISTLFNSALGDSGSGPSIVTSIIAMSTTTVTGLSNASASAAKAADGTEGLTPATPEPVLKDQTIIGVAVGIGIWLLIIIAALSWCLWRKRKIIRERGERLDDDNATSMPPNISQSDVEAIMGMAPTQPGAQSRGMAPTLPPPAFLTSSISTMDSVPGPLGSHPVSRDGRVSHNSHEEMPSLSLFEYENGGTRLSAPSRSPSTLFPGAQRISHYSAVTSISSHSPTNHRSLVKMRALSATDDDAERSTTPEPLAELPPSLGKLNSWLEENRRRSRMTASSSGVGMDSSHIYTNITGVERELEEEEKEEIGRIRADSRTLGTPIMSSRAGPVSRPMSLASLKDVYRRSATLERSIIGGIQEKGVRPGIPAK